MSSSRTAPYTSGGPKLTPAPGAGVAEQRPCWLRMRAICAPSNSAGSVRTNSTPFVASLAVTLATARLAVLAQAYRAARIRPAQVLHHE